MLNGDLNDVHTTRSKFYNVSEQPCFWACNCNQHQQAAVQLSTCDTVQRCVMPCLHSIHKVTYIIHTSKFKILILFCNVEIISRGKIVRKRTECSLLSTAQ